MQELPLVSVVTPFYNTAPYLKDCIESVLSQQYPHFEYILSDNCSTDDSFEIAERYAKRDPRIRLIRQPRFLTQTEHFNEGLRQISSQSKYCKIVNADDAIFPRYLPAMVSCFEQSDSIGLVSSYYLLRNLVHGSGYPYPKPLLRGRELARLVLETGLWVFGSETTVMYRSSIVRGKQPFYDAGVLHADTEACMQILKEWDFGFVHEVLSFIRSDNLNESITAGRRRFKAESLDFYIVVQRYASSFLDVRSAEAVRRSARKEYYRTLSHEALSLRTNSAFWKYHREGLRTIGETIEWPRVIGGLVQRLLHGVVNPGETATRAWRFAAGRRISDRHVF